MYVTTIMNQEVHVHPSPEKPCAQQASEPGIRQEFGWVLIHYPLKV